MPTSRPGRGWPQWSAALAASACMALAGCGSGLKLAPVSGTVTVDGKPAASIAVNFTPLPGQAAGPGSSAVTDAQGRFVLRTIGDKRHTGAVVGKHRVTLTESDPSLAGLPYEEAVAKARQRPPRLPPEARDGSLTFEVPPGGTSEAHFKFPSAAPATK
jgi:hypothetical protein